MKYFKHKKGTVNQIMVTEEKTLLAKVDRALYSSANSQIIGRCGELPLIDFFNRHLPFTLRAATGHFISPGGKLSPQLDIMILDARYPLLAINDDGSVLAMLHSILGVIEIKTNLITNDLKKSMASASKIMSIAEEIDGYGMIGDYKSVDYCLFAYRTRLRLRTLKTNYKRYCKPENAALDIYVLRLPEKDQNAEVSGAIIHAEPRLEAKGKYIPTFIGNLSCLSDLYYRVVQDCYYTLGTRGYDMTDIGNQFNKYMAWSTTAWDLIRGRQGAAGSGLEGLLPKSPRAESAVLR